jgi:serine/threonine-protein kinase
VPDVLNQPVADAQAVLTDEGFTVEVEQRENDQVDEGIVFDQDPDAGQKVDEGSEVTIIVSSTAAPVEVPNLVGQKDVDADAQLRSIGLTADFERVDDPDVPAGTVTAQDPPPGESLPKGSSVKLEVSNGPGQATVPDVKGKDPTVAANELGRAGFETVLAEEPSDEVEEGKVTRTDPSAGTELDKGETVTIYVSSGAASAAVPNVLGMTEDEAVATLQDAGFRVVRITQTVANPANDGRVIAQSPEGGTQAQRGSSVTITVGQSPTSSSTTSSSSSTSSTTTTTTP